MGVHVHRLSDSVSLMLVQEGDRWRCSQWMHPTDGTCLPVPAAPVRERSFESMELAVAFFGALVTGDASVRSLLLLESTRAELRELVAARIAESGALDRQWQTAKRKVE
jgi:hypothetical protein